MRRCIIASVVIVGLIFVQTELVAQTIAGPHQTSQREFSEHNKEKFQALETLLLKDRDAAKTVAATHRFLSEDLNNFERITALRLLGSAYLELDDIPSGAKYLEQACRLFPTSVISRELHLFANTVRLYETEGDTRGASRVQKIWAWKGGDELLLADKIDALRSCSNPLCIRESPRTIGSTPSAPDLVISPKDPPIVPRQYGGRQAQPVCPVHFSVDESGKPYDIRPRCDAFSLHGPAGDYVASLMFRRKILRGEIIRRIDLVYPVAFLPAD